MNAVEPSGRWAPLHWLCDVCYTREAVAELLELGAEPNRRAVRLDETALHVAVRRRRLEAVDQLADAGADLDAVTKGGMTAYRHAVRRNFGEVARRLAERGADTSTTSGDELATALWAGDVERARELLAAEADLAATRVPEEARLLPDLAASGSIPAVRLLLEAGADLSARGLDGGTALHQAAWFAQPEMAHFLIEAGAPLDDHGDDHLSTPPRLGGARLALLGRSGGEPGGVRRDHAPPARRRRAASRTRRPPRQPAVPRRDRRSRGAPARGRLGRLTGRRRDGRADHSH